MLRLSCPHCQTLLSVSEEHMGKVVGCSHCRKTLQVPGRAAEKPAVAPGRRLGDRMTNSLGMVFAWIPPGSFTMGSPRDEPERRNNERQHHVTLTRGFWLGVYPVTQAHWQAVMGGNPSKRPGLKNPVETVSWKDCRAFCEKLEQLDRKPYRLPTESEWEYACRAGTQTPYFFGTVDPASPGRLAEFAWYGALTTEGTRPVGEKKPNPWGLHDMIGNVLEWCSDGYGPYPKEAVVDPPGQGAGEYRVARGGAYCDPAKECRSAARMNFTPNRKIDYIGLRVCFCLD